MNSFVGINFEQVAEPFFLFAGPNVIESEEHVLHMAKHIKNVATKYDSDAYLFLNERV